MALTATFSVNSARIHQGPAYMYHNVLRANPGFRTLVDGGKPASIVDPGTPPAWSATQSESMGAVIKDSNGFMQQVVTAGTTGSTAPTWNKSVGGLTTDSTVTWMNIGAAANLTWAATTAVLIDQQLRDTNNNIQQVLVPGTTGSSAPTWSSMIGGITTDGGVQWVCLGPTIGLSVTEGEAQINISSKFAPIGADQFTAPIDVAPNTDSAEIDCTFKELTLSLVQRTMIQATYSTGTDSGLPGGAQSYEELTGGGLVPLPQSAVTIVIPRRQYANPSKNIVITLYKVYGEGAPLPFGRTKVTEWKSKLTGLAITNRLQGDQIWQWYDQL